MVCDLKFSEDLAARLEAAAQTANLTKEELIVIATAEKLARVEHETWLGKQTPAASGDGSARSASHKDKSS